MCIACGIVRGGETWTSNVYLWIVRTFVVLAFVIVAVNLVRPIFAFAPVLN
jgi:hypothetical protein